MNKKTEIREIRPINVRPYAELSIEELEKRLEMQKLQVAEVDAAGAYGCSCDNHCGDGDVSGCGDY